MGCSKTMNQDLVTDRTLDTTSNILDIDANILELLIRNFEFNFCFITEEILTRQESQKIQNSDLECVFNTLRKNKGEFVCVKRP